MKKMSYKQKRAWMAVNTVINWLLVGVLLVNLYNIAMRNFYDDPLPELFGYGYAVVVSGSMEPTIAIEDTIIVHAEDKYGVGDIITFVDTDSPSGALVTHRIVAVNGDGTFVTKGDANTAEDKTYVEKSNVMGKVVYSFPIFGSILLFVQKPIGTLCLLLFALIFIELPYQLRTRYGKATKARIEEIRKVIGPGSEKKKFTPDLYWEFNDGSYTIPDKTKRQMDFEEELDRRWYKKMKRKVYKPDEEHWNID